MRGLTLKRIATDNDGTYGVLLEGTKPLMNVLERPWRGNEPERSCIPAGLYRCKRVYSGLVRGETFEVQDVEGRSLIRIHPGNTERDSLGCLLPGMGWGELRAIDPDTGLTENQTAVTASKSAFEALMKLLAGAQEFNLWIVWCRENVEEG